jgi:DNA repair protein RecO (recombination protein O)
MLYKTRGIVFKFIKYRESSIIATILTEKLGVQSYIVNSVRTKKPSHSISHFQPLTLLDMVVYNKENATLNRVSEIRCEYQFQSIPYQHSKSAIALFLSEVMYKVIKHESHPDDIFQFVHDSVLSLDHLDSGYENFHLQFLLKLTRYLGFYPESGIEINSQLTHKADNISLEIDTLLNNSYDFKIGKVSNSERIQLLDHILDFYHLHIENLGEINSYRILREVLH